MSFATAVNALSPLFYWRFDETTGATVAVDSSGNGRHGAYNGATLSAPGLLGSDPTNKCTTTSCGIADAAWMPSTDISIMTLVKSLSGAGNQGIVARFNFSNDWILWKNTSSEYAIRFYNTGGSSVDLSATGRGGVDDQAFIVATYTSGSAKLYIDGSLVASSTALTGNIRNGAQAIEAGAYGGAAFDFNGYQDETAVFDTVLSSTDVSDLYSLIGAAPLTFGRVTETDTARPLVVGRSLLLGRATETDTARSLTGATSFASPLGRAAETDTARPIKVVQTRALGRATETDTARIVTPVSASATTIALGRARETDTARTIATIGGSTLILTGSTQSYSFDVLPAGLDLTGNLVVIAMDKVLRRAPTSLAVSVSGADPDEALSFLIDGVEVDTDNANGDGTLQQISIPVPLTVDAGDHVVRVETASRAGEDTFTVQLDHITAPVLQGLDTDAVLIPAAHVGTVYRWVFQDLMPEGLGSWVMPINPSSMTSPGIEKTLTVQHSTAVQTGQFHIWEGGKTAIEWSFSGFCPDQEFYDHLRAYYALTRRFYIIDHRNRAWKVALTNVDMVARKRGLDDAGNPLDWRGDYTVHAVLYDQHPTEPV